MKQNAVSMSNVETDVQYAAGCPSTRHALWVSRDSPGFPEGFYLAGVLDRTWRFLPLTSFLQAHV